MKPTWFIYLTSAFLPLLTLYLLRRVRREYDSEGKLSSTTVSFVWLLYLVQVP
ncbi:MAG TPA: hypothetical protein VFA61_01480 [Candidatus Udaeobacter sp.]|nr:hypothetical protein [Candidatus Udaeobacter sp.]